LCQCLAGSESHDRKGGERAVRELPRLREHRFLATFEIFCTRGFAWWLECAYPGLNAE
jgi:hypothetical protein